MCPKSDKTDANDKKQDSWIRKVAELEDLIKEKTQREETYLNQLKYARADLENLQKNTERRIDEGVTKEKERPNTIPSIPVGMIALGIYSNIIPGEKETLPTNLSSLFFSKTQIATRTHNHRAGKK